MQGSFKSLTTSMEGSGFELPQFLKQWGLFSSFDIAYEFAKCVYDFQDYCLVTSMLIFYIKKLKVRHSRNVFFLAEDSSKKRTKTRRILVKTN